MPASSSPDPPPSTSPTRSAPATASTKLEQFASVVRRALSSLPPPPPGDVRSDDSAASRPSRRRSHDDTASSSTTTTHSPPPPPAFDVTKSLLRSGYSSLQNSKRAPDAIETADEVTTMADAEGCSSGGKLAAMVETAEGGSSVGKDQVRFADLGGIESVIEQLTMEVLVPLCHPELPLWLGVRPVAGILLHGPPGCGKTTLANAIANETGVPFYSISATQVVDGVSGASEEKIRDLFNKAYRSAPSIVFIDEIDAIASKRDDTQRGMERRIVTQLMTCMDEFHQNIQSSDAADKMDDSSQSTCAKKARHVLVIGATNRPDAVDPALRRPGRFDREILLDVPDENARRQILARFACNLRGQFDLLRLCLLVEFCGGLWGLSLQGLVAIP